MNFLISQRHAKNIYGDWIDILENNYINYFSKFDINLVPVSNASVDLKKVIKNINPSGIILTGGDDINPNLYGGKPNGKLSISDARDKIEMELIKHAIYKKIPLLGICRGMQLLNIYFNGQMVQKIEEKDINQLHRCPGFHDVELSDIIFKEKMQIIKKVEVNSYHHSGIYKEMVSNEFKIFAFMKELDLVEGIYKQDLPIAGIQWHPERPNNSNSFNEYLVKSFISRKLFWQV